MKEAFKNDRSPQTDRDPPLSVLLSSPSPPHLIPKLLSFFFINLSFYLSLSPNSRLFLLRHFAFAKPGLRNSSLPLVFKGLYLCPCFLRAFEGPISGGVVRREGAAVLDIS